MAERKLNINAPLLSVRRSSATSPSITEAKKKILEKRNTLPCYISDSSMDLVTEPVAVPFNWEHIPGRRKGNGGSEAPQPPKETSITPSPRLPPGKPTRRSLEKESRVANKFRSSSKSNSFNVSSVKLDYNEERKDGKRVSNVERNDCDDNDDEVFSDALDTLSFTGSVSMNCSASGVSGLDNFNANKSGTFATDPQTRDFMMSRFLPAAKAMTLQPPQYASRKQSAALEQHQQQQPREVKKLVREEKKPLLNTHVTDIVPYSGQCQEEEGEDEGDGCDESGNVSAKRCGLIPQLRIGNSLPLLNPVPAMKMKNQPPLTATTYEAAKPNKGSHIRSYSPAPAIKKAWDAIYKSKSSSRAASPDKQEVRRKWASESNRFNYSGELMQPGRLSPFRRSRAAAAGVSPCRSKPHSPFCGAENNHSGKLKFQNIGHVNIQEMLSQEAKKGSTVEKTLYIDTASTVKLSSANSSSVYNSVVEDLDKKRGKPNLLSVKSSQQTKRLEALEGQDMLNSKVPGSADFSSTLTNMLHIRSQEDKAIEDLNINNRQIVVAENSGLSPLPPPLPKSPSESWLWRALPLVSVKNTFLHSNAKRQDSNTTCGNSKWETIVKTSNLHHDHVRYSQELTAHKSQHSKS